MSDDPIECTTLKSVGKYEIQSDCIFPVETYCSRCGWACRAKSCIRCNFQRTARGLSISPHITKLLSPVVSQSIEFPPSACPSVSPRLSIYQCTMLDIKSITDRMPHIEDGNLVGLTVSSPYDASMNFVGFIETVSPVNPSSFEERSIEKNDPIEIVADSKDSQDAVVNLSASEKRSIEKNDPIEIIADNEDIRDADRNVIDLTVSSPQGADLELFGLPVTISPDNNPSSLEKRSIEKNEPIEIVMDKEDIHRAQDLDTVTSPDESFEKQTSFEIIDSKLDPNKPTLNTNESALMRKRVHRNWSDIQHPKREVIEHIYSDSSQSDDERVDKRLNKYLPTKATETNYEELANPSTVELSPQKVCRTSEVEDASEEEF